jgi:hypothetical protein
VQVCPVACIPVDPNRVESRETLWQKFQRLTAAAAPVMPAPVIPAEAGTQGVEKGASPGFPPARE